MMIPDLPVNSSLISSVANSAPETIVSFAKSACKDIDHCRTIWNIVWSCLGTIFACVWVAIHPNLPQLHPPRNKWSEKLKDGALGLLDKLGISLLALLAPEFILAWALRQYFNASKLAEELEGALEKNHRERVRNLENEYYLAYHDQNDIQGYLSARITAQGSTPNKVADNAASTKDVASMSGVSLLLGKSNAKDPVDVEQPQEECREPVSTASPLPGQRVSLVMQETQDPVAESGEKPTSEEGGFVGAWPQQPRTQAKIRKGKPVTKTQCFFILMGGFHVYDGDKPIAFLFPRDVVRLVGEGKLTLPPTEELEDRGKSDWVAKAVVLLQTLWFVGQCLARFITKLSVTELEVATLAYTVLIGAIYVCWWDKPRGVGQPIRVPADVFNPNVRDFYADNYNTPWSIWTHRARDILLDDYTSAGNDPRVPRFYSGDIQGDWMSPAMAISVLMAFIFGAIHFIAWDFAFPSDTERWLWRAGSVCTVVVPALLSGTLSFKDWNFNPTPFPGRFHALEEGFTIASVVAAVFYVIARVVIIVIAFTTLRSLHPSTYETVYWTTFIPHF